MDFNYQFNTFEFFFACIHLIACGQKYTTITTNKSPASSEVPFTKISV